MKRHLAVTALLSTLVVPCAARAQLLAPEKPLRLTISPLVGYAVAASVKGTALITYAGNASNVVFEYRAGGGPVPGIAIDYLLSGRLAANAAVTYTSRGTST